MEDPVTGDDPIRGAIAEAEAEAESYAAAFLVTPSITWTDVHKYEPGSHTLVIAEGVAAFVLLTSCMKAKRHVGQIVLPGIAQKVTASLPFKEAAPHSADIYEVEGSDQNSATLSRGILLVACLKPVPPARAFAWVTAVLAATQPACTAIISAMPASEFRGNTDVAEKSVLLALPSTAAKASTKDCGQPMPCGGLIAGLPAAIVAHCEMRDELGVALVGVQMSPVPDQVYLKALLIEIEKLLRQLTGDISLAAIDTTPTAIRQALIRCDKAYRGSAADLLYI